MTARVLLIAVAFSAAVLGCSKESKSGAGDDTVSSQAAGPATVDTTLAEYEKIRALLADDQTAGVKDAAKRLATAADGAGAAASAAEKAPLAAISRTAGALVSKPDDIAALRAGFGELSKEIVGLLARSPALQKGRFVFRCPMAPGYQKWIQTTSERKNPYMGKEMLQCGTDTEWKM
jgi:Cu(I)/Ag(I) efflux system membrane fusion protein